MGDIANGKSTMSTNVTVCVCVCMCAKICNRFQQFTTWNGSFRFYYFLWLPSNDCVYKSSGWSTQCGNLIEQQKNIDVFILFRLFKVQYLEKKYFK